MKLVKFITQSGKTLIINLQNKSFESAIAATERASVLEEKRVQGWFGTYIKETTTWVTKEIGSNVSFKDYSNHTYDYFVKETPEEVVKIIKAVLKP